MSTAALLARSTTFEALRTLAAHGLAERGPGGGWRRGPADLDAVAVETGADQLAAEQLAEHRADRAGWYDRLGITAVPDLADLDVLDPEREDQALEGVLGEASAAAVPRVPDQRRRGGRQQRGHPAPPWLVAPPRQRIGEGDLGWSAEALVALEEMREQSVTAETLPDDVRAAVLADLATITDDDHYQATERRAYEAELATLYAAHQGDPDDTPTKSTSGHP